LPHPSATTVDGLRSTPAVEESRMNAAKHLAPADLSRSVRGVIARSAAALFVMTSVAGPSWAASDVEAPAVDTQAKRAIIVDYDTGAVLYDKNADERMPPASMSKMMTAYVVYGLLKEGKASLDDTLPVSEKAWRTGGSKMFVPLGGSVKIEDLVRGMIIQSGNDACIVLAEGLAGSEEAFVERMNAKAQELGLAGSHFANVTGLPAPDEYSTVHDLATLARRLIVDFPEYYHYDSEKEFTYNGIKQGNRNPLLYKEGMGADGLKTGHTEEAGYGVAASVVRGGERIVMVLAGLPTMKSRVQESERMVEWAYREFRHYPLFKAGEPIEEVDVWMGTASKVPVTVAKDAAVTFARAARRGMKVTLDYDGPISAPVAKGQVVGKLVVSAPDVATTEFPVVAADDVPKLTGIARMLASAAELLFGSDGRATSAHDNLSSSAESAPAPSAAHHG
jgi:serine-type D-Ala-D-Ala carboxypeptidase (penicillin-binding protein 5/6)